MDQLRVVVERVSADPDLAAKLTRASSVEERRQLLRDADIEVTDDLREQARSLGQRLNLDVDDPESWTAIELSEDELNEVVGGTIIAPFPGTPPSATAQMTATLTIPVTVAVLS